jgi:hypothetical protein
MIGIDVVSMSKARNTYMYGVCDKFDGIQINLTDYQGSCSISLGEPVVGLTDR